MSLFSIALSDRTVSYVEVIEDAFSLLGKEEDTGMPLYLLFLNLTVNVTVVLHISKTSLKAVKKKEDSWYNYPEVHSGTMKNFIHLSNCYLYWSRDKYYVILLFIHCI